MFCCGREPSPAGAEGSPQVTLCFLEPFSPLPSLCQRKRRIPIPIRMSSLESLTAPTQVGVLLLCFVRVIERYLEVQRGMAVWGNPLFTGSALPSALCWQSRGARAAAGTEQTCNISPFCRKMHVVATYWPRTHLQAD